MTIICAQKTTTGVLLGADNPSTDGSRVLRRATPKLRRISDRIVFGSSGNVRLYDMLCDIHTCNDFPKPSGDLSPQYVIDAYEADLARFFRAFFKDEFRANEKQSLWSIVAVDNHIFDVGPDGSVIRVDERFDATGSVERIALGALYVINKNHVALPTADVAREWLQTTMEACAEFGECIRPPWCFAATTKHA